MLFTGPCKSPLFFTVNNSICTTAVHLQHCHDLPRYQSGCKSLLPPDAPLATSSAGRDPLWKHVPYAGPSVASFSFTCSMDVFASMHVIFSHMCQEFAFSPTLLLITCVSIVWGHGTKKTVVGLVGPIHHGKICTKTSCFWQTSTEFQCAWW